jgi:plastocyanin
MKVRGAIALVALAVLAAACAGQRAQPQGEGKDQGNAQGGPTEIQVQSEEYKFGGVPSTLPAGEVTFALENVGQEPHEFGLVRIKGDHSVEELIQMPPSQSEKLIADVGSTFAKPGEESSFKADLEAGRYGYACFVETKGKPHALMGMYGGFTVA